MLEHLSHPSHAHSFLQYVAASIYIFGMIFFLRKNFSPLKLLGILVASTALVSFFAKNVAALAGTADGQSYFGALAAQIFGLFLFLKFSRTPALVRARAWKAFAILSGLVYATLRLGCHFRGCCWGRICPYPWATFYRHPEVVTPWMHLPLHPAPLYASIHGLVTALIVVLYARRLSPTASEQNSARALGLFLILMGFGRLFTDFFRADAKFYKQSWFGLEPNTVLASIAVLAGVATLSLRLGRKNETSQPGAY